jgi:hypothetical protein
MAAAIALPNGARWPVFAGFHIHMMEENGR